MTSFKIPDDSFLIRTDSGPDVVVRKSFQVGRVEIVDSKTSKVAGSMTLYNHPKSVVIHVIDRRRKAGDVVLAWTFSQPLNVEKVMEISGGGRAIKELLQKCGYSTPEVVANADDLIVE